MVQRFKQVTDAELTVLDFLWEVGRATKREITAAVYPAETDSDQATVGKLLQRLEMKGHVTRDRSNVAHVFSPSMNKSEFAGYQLEAVAERFSEGSFFPLVMHLVENRRLTKAERDRLRCLLDPHV